MWTGSGPIGKLKPSPPPLPPTPELPSVVGGEGLGKKKALDLSLWVVEGYRSWRGVGIGTCKAIGCPVKWRDPSPFPPYVRHSGGNRGERQRRPAPKESRPGRENRRGKMDASSPHMTQTPHCKPLGIANLPMLSSKRFYVIPPALCDPSFGESAES